MFSWGTLPSGSRSPGRPLARCPHQSHSSPNYASVDPQQPSSLVPNTRTHTQTRTLTGNHSSYKHRSQLHFQTWITTELTLCDPLPKQKDAPLYIQTHMHIRKQVHVSTNTHTHTHIQGAVWVELSVVRF